MVQAMPAVWLRQKIALSIAQSGKPEINAGAESAVKSLSSCKNAQLIIELLHRFCDAVPRFDIPTAGKGL